MRKEIKEGKERLKVLLSEKRDKKNDKARVMGILTLLDFWTVFLGVTKVCVEALFARFYRGLSCFHAICICYGIFYSRSSLLKDALIN